jgi:diaminopimelate epimerase
MNVEFTKMHGCGNDYVYINGFRYEFEKDMKTQLAVRLSERHFGIGSDGLIFINPSPIADFEMEMYNADGSRAEMCGNGIRCVAKYVYDHHMTDKTQFTIESFGKIKYITVKAEDGKMIEATVDMGEPILKGEDVPVDTGVLKADAQGRVIASPLKVLDRTFDVTCVSMGNPHAVVFTQTGDVEKYGPDFEVSPAFPRRVNTEFVNVTDRKNVDMRVWERGTGETLACGTGCCATAVACVLNGLTDDEITIHVLGGDIRVRWDRESNHVFMTGPAAVSFTGTVEI